MNDKKYLILGREVTAGMGACDADIRLAWMPVPGSVPLMLAKKRFKLSYAAGYTVREAASNDMPVLRGLYDMTAGKGVLLPVKEGARDIKGALVCENSVKEICAYAVGSPSGGVLDVHEFGCLPDADTAAVLSAMAAYSHCVMWQLRAELCPQGGTVSGGECVYICVDKPFMLGCERIDTAKQLVEMIEDSARI